jgi:hypothetical protein
MSEPRCQTAKPGASKDRTRIGVVVTESVMGRVWALADHAGLPVQEAASAALEQWATIPGLLRACLEGLEGPECVGHDVGAPCGQCTAIYGLRDLLRANGW